LALGLFAVALAPLLGWPPVGPWPLLALGLLAVALALAWPVGPLVLPAWLLALGLLAVALAPLLGWPPVGPSPLLALGLLAVALALVSCFSLPLSLPWSLCSPWASPPSESCLRAKSTLP